MVPFDRGPRRQLNRREMLGCSAATLAAPLGLGGALLRPCAASAGLAPAKLATRDKFGGCPEIRFDGTGYFRLEHAKRWWLVTPEGNAFLSFGANHVIPAALRTPYNLEHWLRTFGAKDVNDPAFIEGFRRKVRQDFEAFGFNTLGVHSPTKWYPQSFCPYIHGVQFAEISHWQSPPAESFLDIFSESFLNHCNARAKAEIEPRRDDPFLIAYAFSDCPIFTERDAAPRTGNIYGSKRVALPTWPRVLRNLGRQAAGKQVYVGAMRKLYADDIGGFNKTYGTQYGTFDELLDAKDWRPDNDATNATETRDNTAFLNQCVERYYQVVVAAVRKYDGNHLIFGDKLNGNTDGADAVLPIASRYTDLVFHQTFGFYDQEQALLDRWSKLTGKPLFNGDSSYAVPSPTMPDPYGPHLASQEERARVALEYAEGAFARPDVVGWSVCGWVDAHSPDAPAGMKQHSGLQTPLGEYHQPMLQALSGFSRRMYELASRSSAS